MKQLLLTLAALYAMGGQAQETDRKWALEEPKSGTTVLMGDISFLLASDRQDTFTIVCKDGTVVSGAESVNFVKATPSGISHTQTATGTPQMAISAAEGLTLTGCKAGTHVSIYDTAGRLCLGATATDGPLRIDVSRLTPGIYMLKAGETAIKFIKK